MRFLMKQTDVYRVEAEEDAMRLIEEFKNNQISEGYTVTKSGYVLKTKKAKGVVVEEWFLVTIERSFNEE